MIIDVRPPEMFAAGHVEGAINIPAAKMREQLDKLDKKRPLVVICKIGMNGYFMERMLKQSGFEARNMMGGFTYLQGILP